MITITTELAPAAKPIPASLPLTNIFQDMLECPQYDIPVAGFSADRRIAPGLVEISSPLIASCTGDDGDYIDIRLQRNNGDTITLLHNRYVAPYDPLLVPLNGTMLLSGDVLQIKSATGGRIHATISATVGQAEEDSAL